MGRENFYLIMKMRVPDLGLLSLTSEAGVTTLTSLLLGKRTGQQGDSQVVCIAELENSAPENVKL